MPGGSPAVEASGDGKTTEPTSSDIGKPVVTASNDVIGSIVDVTPERVIVTPANDILAGLSSWVCCPWERYDAFRLKREAIDRIETDRVVLKTGSV